MLFFGAAAWVVLVAEVVEEPRRAAPSLEVGREPPVVEFERRDDELMVRGLTGGFGVAAGVLAARPRTGGEGFWETKAGDLGVAGLFQDEKKSSSPSPWEAGVTVNVSAPSTTTFSGYL